MKACECVPSRCKLLWARLPASPFFVGSADIWFGHDTNSQNAAYQWKLKVEIPQEGLGEAVGYNRYLTEPVDV